MPEPDFDQIARAVVKSLDEEAGSPGDQFDEDALVLLITEALRQVWNARGAADDEVLQIALGALADIATAEDMTEAQRRHKAARIHAEITATRAVP